MRLDETRKAIATGDLYFEIQMLLGGGRTNLRITDKQAKVFKQSKGRAKVPFLLK
jgi:hypothetical protein